MLAGELGERGQLGGPTDQRADRFGQVSREAGEPLALSLERSRIRHDNALDRHSEELQRTADVLEPEPAEADHVDVASVLDLVIRGVGQHHPAGHCERLDPGRDVHRVAREPLGLDDHVAHVDADANRNLVRGELSLDLDCGEHR